MKSSPRGVAFPALPGGNSMQTVKGALAAAFHATQGGARGAAAMMEDKNWRESYVEHFRKLIEVGLRDDDDALAAAEAGLAYLHRELVFFSAEGKETPLAVAMAQYEDTKQTLFSTAVVQGSGLRQTTLAVPYQVRRETVSLLSEVGAAVGAPRLLSGDTLRDQLRRWMEKGVLDSQASAALSKVLDNERAWLDLRGQVFVVLGAGAAMGPLQGLLTLGATVVAIDLDRASVWEKLIEFAKGTSGKLVAPRRADRDAAGSEKDLAGTLGCNLLTETPEIAAWLAEVFPDDELTVGSYAYADGSKHVLIAVAMDSIATALMARRKKPIHLAYLNSPIGKLLRNPASCSTIVAHST